jgi:hypothetical protein
MKNHRVRAGLVTGLLCVASVASLMSCSGPVVTAVGESDDIVVVCDANDSELAELVVSTLEAGQQWLLGEPLFRTTLTTPGQSGDLRNMRHVLLVGAWGGGSAEMAHRVFPGLGPDAAPELRLAEDIWAKRQVVAAVVASDESSLAAYLREHGEELRWRLADASVARLSTALRDDADEKGLTEAMLQRFGWSLAMPPGYDLFTTNEEDGFVFFRRTAPDRTVFLYWAESVPAALNESYAMTMREEIAGAYLDGDAIEWNRPLVVETVEFLGRPAIRISGWWGNRKLVGGGPFRSYFFYDESSGRVYLLDLSLFAPGYDKTALMRNLEAIAQTFTLGQGTDG